MKTINIPFTQPELDKAMMESNVVRALVLTQLFPVDTVEIFGVKVEKAKAKAIAQTARQGEKIQAIKDLRTITGLGLRESKEAVEKWAVELF